jgi:hypothetical protein
VSGIVIDLLEPIEKFTFVDDDIFNGPDDTFDILFDVEPKFTEEFVGKLRLPELKLKLLLDDTIDISPPDITPTLDIVPPDTSKLLK